MTAAEKCPACYDTGVRELPTADGLAPVPCPICFPWDEGFPGERVLARQPDTHLLGAWWIIGPAAPGQPAVWHGWPERTASGV